MIKKIKKIALITGVTGDIGRSVCASLLEQGYMVLGISSNKKRQEELKKIIKINKNNLILFKCDLSKLNQVEVLCKKIKKHYGTPNIIINNAGIFNFLLLQQISLKEIDHTFNVNVMAPIVLCRSFINDFKKRRSGKIINICSSSSYNGGGTHGHTVYSATKHGLLGFSRALDEEVRKYNIRVGTISPAGVEGRMISNRKDLDKKTMMKPSEVTDAVNYLMHANGKSIVYEIRLWRMLR